MIQKIIYTLHRMTFLVFSTTDVSTPEVKYRTQYQTSFRLKRPPHPHNFHHYLLYQPKAMATLPPSTSARCPENLTIPFLLLAIHCHECRYIAYSMANCLTRYNWYGRDNCANCGHLTKDCVVDKCKKVYYANYNKCWRCGIDNRFLHANCERCLL